MDADTITAAIEHYREMEKRTDAELTAEELSRDVVHGMIAGLEIAKQIITDGGTV